MDKLVEDMIKQVAIEYVRDLVKRAKKDCFSLSESDQEFLSVLSNIIWDMDRVKKQTASEIKKELESDFGGYEHPETGKERIVIHKGSWEAYFEKKIGKGG